MSRLPFAIALALALSLLFTSAASARPKHDTGLSGTIDLATSERSAFAAAAATSTTPSYGETVWFATTVNGDTKANSLLYVLVVCAQDGTVVYQWSGAPDFGFPLVDQTGQGLDWDGANADCTAALIYRVQKGKNVSISTLDRAYFAVSATSTS
jgi:hypothetical protein